MPQSRSEKKNPPSPPVLFTKLESDRGDEDWNARPRDLESLLDAMKEMDDTFNFTCNTKPFAAIDADPTQNPILYRSGHYNWDLDDAEKAKLRAYLLRGGTLVLNAGLGSKPFYNSAKRVMAEVFPEATVQRLSPDHPVFRANPAYNVTQVRYRPSVRNSEYSGNEPWLEGVTIDCRTVCFISRFGMDGGWDPRPDEPEGALVYEEESAKKLGMSLFSYAAAMQKWANNTAMKITYENADTVTVANSMGIGQVIYDGEWKTRHAGLSMLLKEFNRKTEIPVKFSNVELRLTDSGLQDVPVLYMTGHDAFTLKPAEVRALQAYLTNGGTLIAEACCGRTAFDKSFKDLMTAVLPQVRAEVPQAGHPIYAMPNRITTLTPTEAFSAATGKAQVDPELLFWKVDNNVAVIYSPRGMAGGWELSPSPYSLGYVDADSLRLGEDILMYAITR
ncbi:MAG: DUF4159 domain-containing protein, partial [Kiritimatiellaeota bacterium]|nr:DUF4159 domain-containing protein [Kiritimatiellota bacterium]